LKSDFVDTSPSLERENEVVPEDAVFKGKTFRIKRCHEMINHSIKPVIV